MNQIRSKRIGIGIAGALLIAGCATSSAEPTKALVRARTLHETAEQSAAEHAQVELDNGNRLLAGAESEHNVRPRSNLEKHLANLAASRFEIAMAEARRRAAFTRADAAARQIAELTMRRMQDGGVAVVQQGEGGTTVTLTGAVLFNTGESELLPIARDHLQSVADALKAQDQKVTIVVEGHADARGTEEFNKELSERRAEAVKVYLVERGLDPELIHVVGCGEREPIATNKTPEGRANNRRVEIVLQGQG